MQTIYLRPLMLGTLLSLAALSSGCADNQLVYGEHCVTCLNNPLSGEPLNYDPKKHPNSVLTVGAANQSQGSGSGLAMLGTPNALGQDQCQLTYRGDVDTAAALIKDAFSFMTQEEAIAENGQGGKWQFSSGDWSYSGTPGAFYTMKKAAYDGHLMAKISKTGGGSKVVLTYIKVRQGQWPVDSTIKRIQTVAQNALR